MTELDKLKRAKAYLEKLADGVNPLDNSLVPESELINNVRISRCFFYAADVLQQVIDRGGIAAPVRAAKPKKLPFHIPPDIERRFVYSDRAITASELAARISALSEEENRQPLPVSALHTWLGEIGMLEWRHDAAGHAIARPTATGRANGLSVITRKGEDGTYQLVVYDAPAQELVVDNLEAVLAAENYSAGKHGAAWTAEQDETLTSLYQKGVLLREIAVTLDRTTSAVRRRLKKLGLLQYAHVE